VRITVEYGWGNSKEYAAHWVATAKTMGLKVLVVVQKNTKVYDGGLADYVGLVELALYVASVGADAIEIGNEWNHEPFWHGAATSLPPAAQASMTWAISARIHEVYPKQVVIPAGLSPETVSPPLAPYLWLPAFWNVNSGQHEAAGYAGINLHPYSYPSNSMTNGVPDHQEWERRLPDREDDLAVDADHPRTQGQADLVDRVRWAGGTTASPRPTSRASSTVSR
jgi:hypothetical protein